HRGEINKRKGTILIARLANSIAEREQNRLLEKTNWPTDSIQIERVNDSSGPGNIVMLEITSENVTELFTGFGEISVNAETVAQKAVDQYRDYLTADVPVGRYLADQIMMPLGLAAYQGSGASTFRTLPLSQHSKTHIEILRQFLDIDINIQAGHLNERQVNVHIH
ncbi:MAG: RNA 3'-terminal phosphate cyclase, partial [Thermoguttaceae bacterium]